MSSPCAPSEGRIRRHVSGRTHRFALVFPPGLEQAGRDEAHALGFRELPADEGDDRSCMEWEGRLEDLMRAAAWLRIPSRIHLRMGRFRAGAREELFAAVSRIPWELWLTPGPLRVQARLEHSRISHEGQAAATVEEAVRRRWTDCGLAMPENAACPPSGDSGDSLEGEEDPSLPDTPRLLLHMDRNHGSLSLDATGPLYRRGWRRAQGSAPFREDLAAGILQAAGWPRARVLVDPMCGSGTFAIEALARARTFSSRCVDAIPAFRSWPAFAPAAWAWQHSRGGPGPLVAPPAVYGLDWHAGVLAKAGENLERFLSDVPGDRRDQARKGISLEQKDFFTLDPGAFLHGTPPEDPPLLIMNPPWGLRLDDHGGDLYPRIWNHLARVWPDWRAGVLAPEGKSPPNDGTWHRALSLRHGGIRVAFWLRDPLAGTVRYQA